MLLSSQSVPHAAGALRFQAALEAHKHWPTDDLALLLAGSFLHGGSAALSGGATSGGAPLAEAGSDMQQDGSADGAGTAGSPAAHLWEHVELGLGCLRAAITQGLLSRDDLKQVQQGLLLVEHTIVWVCRAAVQQAVVFSSRLSHTYYAAINSTGCAGLQRGGCG